MHGSIDLSLDDPDPNPCRYPKSENGSNGETTTTSVAKRPSSSSSTGERPRKSSFKVRDREPVPSIHPRTQGVILSFLAPSYVDDGKSLDESSKIGVMNQSYCWPR